MVIDKFVVLFHFWVYFSETNPHFIDFLSDQSLITGHALYVWIYVMDLFSISCDERFCVGEDSRYFILDLNYFCNVFLIVALYDFNYILLFFIKSIPDLINIKIGFLHKFLI